MVTETATETQTSTEVTGLTTGDAANQTANAASTTPDSAETDVQAFLDGKESADGASKEAVGGEAGKVDAVDPLIKEAREAAAEAERDKVRREEADRITRESRQRAAEDADRQAKAAHEAGYKSRIAKQQAPLINRLVEQGLDLASAQAIAKDVETDFNSHHADGLKLYEPEARRVADAEASKLVNDAFREVLGADAVKFFGTDDAPKSHQGMEAALNSFRDIAREGYVLKSEAEADKKVTLLAYRRDLEQKGLIKGTTTGQSVNSTGGAGTGTYSTKTQARTLHVTGQLTNAEMRRINADSSIPEI